MAKLTHWLRNHLPTQRRLIQLYAALLYNAHLKGYISGNIYTGSTKSVCVPGFNCYSCPGAVGACPLGALQNAIASSGSRTPVYVLGILLLYGIGPHHLRLPVPGGTAAGAAPQNSLVQS